MATTPPSGGAGNLSPTGDASASGVNPKMRKRTKTGCLTCRKRRIKCGEERPTCANCIKSKRPCEGYNQRVIFKPPIGDWPNHPGVVSALQYHSSNLPGSHSQQPQRQTQLTNLAQESSLTSIRPRPLGDFNFSNVETGPGLGPSNVLGSGSHPYSQDHSYQQPLASPHHLVPTPTSTTSSYFPQVSPVATTLHGQFGQDTNVGYQAQDYTQGQAVYQPMSVSQAPHEQALYQRQEHSGLGIWSDQARSTNLSSLSYEASADMEQMDAAPKVATMQENLQLDVAQTSSEQSFSNYSEGERRDVTKSWPLETQAGETTQLMHNEDSPTRELSRPRLQNSRSGLSNFVVPQLEIEERSCNSLPSLPLLVDMLLRSLPLPESEPPIPEGKVRARWKCRCGARLFDDFTELESGSVKELERELQELDGSANRTRNLGQTISDCFGALWKPIEHRLQKQRPSNSIRGNMLPLDEVRKRSNVLPRSNATQQPNQSGARCQDTLHLLLCIEKGNSGTPLHQEHLEDVGTDRELFLFLRSEYFRHWNVRHWFTLRNIGSLSLSRFAVDFSNFTEVHKHVSICVPTCVCLPPVDRLDREYRCRPAPEAKPKYEPAIGSQRLTHYFLSPQCVQATQKTILAQLPKRIGHLRALNDQEEIGWGIHFQEGWHWRTVYFVVVLVASSSLVFGIVWSITKRDIQGAFAMSSFWLTLGSLLLGYMVVRSA